MAFIRTYSYTDEDKMLIKSFDDLPGGKSENILKGMKILLNIKTKNIINLHSNIQEWKDYFNKIPDKEVKQFQKKWVELDYLLRKRVEKLL